MPFALRLIVAIAWQLTSRPTALHQRPRRIGSYSILALLAAKAAVPTPSGLLRLALQKQPCHH